MLLDKNDVVGAAFNELLEGTPSSSISSGDSQTVRRRVGGVSVTNPVHILPRKVIDPGGRIDISALV
jgi:hypothetical protein